MKKLAIFASGSGSNAENIITRFRQQDVDAEVALIITNRYDAGVIERAHRLKVPCMVLPASLLRAPDYMLKLLDDNDVDLIVLAGYLLMVPSFLVERYQGRIVNIHPSLLPRHGGKGMYGHHVHEAVIASGDTESGITVHKVSEVCDGGEIVFQARVAVEPGDTAADVERKVRELEIRHFPDVVASLL